MGEPSPEIGVKGVCFRFLCSPNQVSASQGRETFVFIIGQTQFCPAGTDASFENPVQIVDGPAILVLIFINLPAP
jgi:hypothetical protein